MANAPDVECHRNEHVHPEKTYSARASNDTVFSGTHNRWNVATQYKLVRQSALQNLDLLHLNGSQWLEIARVKNLFQTDS